MSQFYELLADKVVGTNISGLNGPKKQEVPAARAREFEDMRQQFEALRQHATALEKQLNSKALSLAVNEAELQTARLSEYDAARSKAGISLLNDESRRLSQSARIENFITLRGEAYLKSIGKPVGNGTFNDVLKQLEPRERFTFNIYVLASADYLVYETTVSNMLFAAESLLNEYRDGEREMGDGVQAKQVVEACNALVRAMMEINRLDHDFFKEWFKGRVAQYAQNMRVDNQSGALIFTDVPPAKFCGIETLALTAETISQIHQRLPEVAKQYVGDNAQILFPPAYKTDSFNLQSKTMPVF